MRVIALSTLKVFWEEHPECMDAKEPILDWYRHSLVADWITPADVKKDFRNTSILKESLPHEQIEYFGYGPVVFNIAGNKYRVVYIRFIGTHAQYDRVDVQTV